MQKVLIENEAEKIIAKFVPVAKNKLVKNISEARAFNKFPCVIKIMSKQALHKTEIGGVIIVKNKLELDEAFKSLESIVKKNKLHIKGYLMQEFVKGRELFVGIKKDPVFDHVIVFGIGGIFVEFMKDISIRVCPITNDDAQSMIDDLKMSKIIYGARNQNSVNIAELKRTLVKLSKLPSKYKDLTELDINPLIANEENIKVVDARMVFG